MNATIIQAMIARNANTITREAAMMQTYINFAKEEAAKGEKSFAVEYYKKADKKRKLVASLTTLQRAMRAQLKAIYREARIPTLHAKLQSVYGYSAVQLDPSWTSIEKEEFLVTMLDAVYPKKPDSRLLKKVVENA